MSIEKIKKLREMTKAGLSDVKKALESTNYNIDKAVIWLRENGVLKASKKADRIAAEGVVKIKETKTRIAIIEVNSETDFVSSNQMFKKATDEILKAILSNKITTLEELKNLKIDNQSFDKYIASLIATIGEKIDVRRIKVFDLTDKEINHSSYVHSNNRIGSIVLGKDIEEKVLYDIAMHIAAMSPEYLSLDNISQERREEEYKIAKKELADSLNNKPEGVQNRIIEGKVRKALSEIVLLEQPFIKDSSRRIKDLEGRGKIVDFVRFEVGSGIEKKKENFEEEVAKQAGIPQKQAKK